MKDSRPQPHITAKLDQLEAVLRAFAVPLGAFFQTLMVQGFTREEALEITLAQQAILGHQHPEEDL